MAPCPHLGETMALTAAMIFAWTSLFFTTAGRRLGVGTARADRHQVAFGLNHVAVAGDQVPIDDVVPAKQTGKRDAGLAVWMGGGAVVVCADEVAHDLVLRGRRNGAGERDHVAGANVGGKGRIQILQSMTGHLRRIGDGVGIFAGKNNVGIDPVAVFPDPAASFRLQVTGYWFGIHRSPNPVHTEVTRLITTGPLWSGLILSGNTTLQGSTKLQLPGPY